MTAQVLHLIPPGKIRCYVTDKLRKDTPEEHVRQRWARSLVEEYGYPKEDIGVNVCITMGRARKFADLVVFREGRTQSEAFIIVEAKRDDKKPSDGKFGEDQLKSYMAASPICRYGLWVGQERRAFERDLETGEIKRIGDIPRFGESEPQLPVHADLAPAYELKSVFRRCHNYIYANAGLQPDQAFYELLKLIFCKTFDEEEGGDHLAFAVHARERTSESGLRRLMEERLNPLFARIIARYPFIFEPDERIKLKPRVAAYVVYELQYVSLRNTNTDVKGAAYEELVGANLRGDRGQYFTPRNVCDMAVEMTMALFPEDALTSLKVVDCCCGTGGFLVSWLNHLYRAILAQEKRRGGTEAQARERLRRACEQNLFGLDIDGQLVRTAQMNLVLHGDGSSNVFRADSARAPGEWDGGAQRVVPYGEADVVLTNPPFGGEARIDDGHILEQYELTRWDSDNPRSYLPAEELFVEGAWRFARPGGYVGIVLPRGILNNPKHRFIRRWLLSRSRIVASIDLPTTTFAAKGGVNHPSLLLLRKLTIHETMDAGRGIIDMSQPIFMTAPQTAGVTKRGKPIYLRHADGQFHTHEGDKVIDDQIRAVAEEFKSWRRG